MTGYKRPLPLFDDLDRLTALARRYPVQLVLAGKPHPRDEPRKRAIRKLHEICRALRGKITCPFLPNCDMRVAMALVAGCDAWLNTPLPPLETPGTTRSTTRTRRAGGDDLAADDEASDRPDRLLLHSITSA